jgi:hypothetical protein
MNARTVFHGFVLAAAVVFCITAASGPASAGDKKIKKSTLTEIDFDDCDPFEVSARIMEVDPDGDFFVVAEKEIRYVDLSAGDRPIRTVHLDMDGKAQPAGRYREGEHVQVKGWAHPDGFVAAASIQRIAKPLEEKPKLTADKPQTRKERKLARRMLRRSAAAQ